MVLGRYVVDAVVLEGRSPTELARSHGISRTWIYELVKRYRHGGYEALEPLTTWQPRLERITNGEEIRALGLGDERVDRYLEFVGARGRRNTWLATAFDLKVFFDLVTLDPCAVTTAHVLDFIREQRRPRHGGKIVRLEARRHRDQTLVSALALGDEEAALSGTDVRGSPQGRSGRAADRAADL